MTTRMTACLLAAGLFLSGCASGTASATASPSPSDSSTPVASAVSGDAYAAYQTAYQNRTQADAWTAAVKESYDMTFSDDTMQSFLLDGVLTLSGIGSDPMGQLSQNIDNNGMASTISGWYKGGRLYNTYNGVSYYEDMSVDDLKKTMLVPMDPLLPEKSQIDSITAGSSEDGTVYTMTLSADAAKSIFSSRYDSYGLSEYSDYAVSAGTITDTFAADGSFVKETSAFTVTVSQDSSPVKIAFASELNYAQIGSAQVTLSADVENSLASYVSYQDIDTSKITTETTDDDSAEATVTATFQKRLISRLGYTVADNGTYGTTFNTNEGYIIDFTNHIFTYENYTISYIYNWKSDKGTYDACTYDFAAGTSTGTCDDTYITQMKNAKSSLQMELYYCGLSLDDLRAES
jgi:hypothetical protein